MIDGSSRMVPARVLRAVSMGLLAGPVGIALTLGAAARAVDPNPPAPTPSGQASGSPPALAKAASTQAAPPAPAGQSAPAQAGQSAAAQAGQSAPAQAGQSAPAQAGQSAPAQAPAQAPGQAPAAPTVSHAPAAPAATAHAGPAPAVEGGILKDPVYGVRFPVPHGWTLKSGASSDEMVFDIQSCDDCLLRILVTPGDKGSLEDTVRVLREHIAQDPESRIVGEEPITVARESAYTIVKEETVALPDPGKAAPPAQTKPDTASPPGGTVRIKTRYVTLSHAGRKYYLLLRAPSKRFPSDDKAFEDLLAKFQFAT